MMDTVILNVDLGEGESPAHSTELIKCIDAANIACGGHAGSDASMRLCLQLCLQYNTLPGAHPGIPGEFGRGTTLPTPKELSVLLTTQWRRLNQIAESQGISLHHIKLHGSLYMAVETQPELAEAYLHFLASLNPLPVIFALAEGTFLKHASENGFTVWGELFGDRNYEPNGSLRARSHSDSLIIESNEIENRIARWIDQGKIECIDKNTVPLSARTICLHSDTPNALATAKRIQLLLSDMRKQ